jgi:hypothetical protein
MSEKSPRGSKTEKAARFYRDANIIGVVACFGFGLLVPPVAIATNALGAFTRLTQTPTAPDSPPAPNKTLFSRQ